MSIASINSEIYSLNSKIEELKTKIADGNHVLCVLSYLISDLEAVISGLIDAENGLNSYYVSDEASKKAVEFAEGREKVTSDKNMAENIRTQLKSQIEQMSDQIAIYEQQIRRLKKRKKDLEGKTLCN